MKTKDGRRAYGSPPVCECGNLATIKFASALVCERCYKVDKRNFKDKTYCGVFIAENCIQDEGGEMIGDHTWRTHKSNYFDSNFE